MGKYHLDPKVTAVNRLPARARRFANSRTLSLDGEWMFRLYDRPEDCGACYAADFDEAGYRPIRMPGNWETQGFGKPIYTNYVYPWAVDGENGVDGMPDPWRVPRDNPTGCYRLRFELPEDMANDDLILRFDGVETAYELYVNGAFVGYAEDSKLTSEFDIRAHVRPGENLLALRVFTFATSSYLEDQDYWYLCGIHRSVTLISVPAARMEDFRVRAVADRHLEGGVFSADVRVARVPGFQTFRVRARLADASGAIVAETEAPVSARAEYSQYQRPTANTARIAIPLARVLRWSPEEPNLYTAEFTLLGANGEALDSDSCRVGFKRVDIEDGILLFNGRRLLVFGVNRHEHAWKSGRAVSRAHMIEEIRSMKRMNINAVRTSHYPDSPLWYELCDEMGILVLCECNLETHGVSGQISHDPEFACAYLERAERMVMQYKNHACIYGWSLGNESGFGANHAAMYGFIKEYDPTRICQYEAGGPGQNISDVRGQMYATEKQILAMLTDPRDNRPVILVEYLYQIRNSGGGMHKFIELMRRYERFQGGFVWDWQDKSLLGKTCDGAEYFAHGGDFGESFVEPREPAYMTNNGLVRADLTWKPVAHEVREAYAPLLIDPPHPDNAWMAQRTGARFTVTNHSLTHRARAYAVAMAVLDGRGMELARFGIEIPDLAPGEHAMIDVSEHFADLAHEPSLYLEFMITHIATGAAIARRQFAHRRTLPVVPAAPRGLSAPTISDGGDAYRVHGADFDISIRKQDGALIRFDKNGITRALESRICYDRPYCGLDAREGWGWREAMDDARAMALTYEPVRVLHGEGEIALTCAFSEENGRLRGTLRWAITGDGALRLSLDAFAAEGLMLPRLGLALTVPAGFDAAEYLGYGPYENYSDRMLAPRFGLHRAQVCDLGFDFAPPSENGGREGVQSLLFKNDAGDALCIRGEQPFHFDARRNTVEDIKRAMHTHELPERSEITLHLDAYHAPIGGDMAWSTAIDRLALRCAGAHSLRVVIG
jgi:beta-galactosidase